MCAYEKSAYERSAVKEESLCNMHACVDHSFTLELNGTPICEAHLRIIDILDFTHYFTSAGLRWRNTHHLPAILILTGVLWQQRERGRETEIVTGAGHSRPKGMELEVVTGTKQQAINWELVLIWASTGKEVAAMEVFV